MLQMAMDPNIETASSQSNVLVEKKSFCAKDLTKTLVILNYPTTNSVIRLGKTKSKRKKNKDLSINSIMLKYIEFTKDVIQR